MWKTIERDGYPDPGVECFVWAPGWSKPMMAEAFHMGDLRGFSNSAGGLGDPVNDATHWLPLGYPPIPEAAPAAKPKRSATRAT